MGHAHTHSNCHSHGDFQTPHSTFLLVSTLNFLFIGIEAFYGLKANSMSLLADAGHNLGDLLGLLLAWFSMYFVSREASVRYTYGYKRITILAAFLNAVLLISTSLYLGYESILKLMHPEPVHEIIVMIVATGAILVNGSSAFLFARKQQTDLNLRGAFLHLLADALISLGVVLGAVLVYFTGWHRVDPFLSLVIILFIFYTAWRLFQDALNLILDAVPSSIHPQEVEHYFLQIPGVAAIHDLHIWNLSTQEVALTAHIVMPCVTWMDEDYDKINRELNARFHISHVTIQVERGNSQEDCHQVKTCR